MPTFSRATLDLGSTETEVDGASVVVHEQRRTTALDMERRVVANRRSTSFKRSSSEEMGSDEDVLMQQSAYLRMIAYLRRSNIESGSSSESTWNVRRVCAAPGRFGNGPTIRT